MRTTLVSKLAEDLKGSEIIKLAGEIAEKIKQGEPIINLTIGDFNPQLFPIPKALKTEIISAYENDMTNYPPANGIIELREAVSQFIARKESLNYSPDEIQIACGARPLIYATYQALINPDEKVLFPVPSWNNNHYCHLSHAQRVEINTVKENNFMPTDAEIKPYISKVAMIALCSPLNPTGTVFSMEQLENICQLVLDENIRREKINQKPLYLLFDQIYSLLTFDETVHVSPVQLFPALEAYTIYIDGLSKAFAATGVRVGWAFGPKNVMQKMKSILGHIGAWAPKAEQVAVAKYLTKHEQVDTFLQEINQKVEIRLTKLFQGFKTLRDQGYRITPIEPKAAIYLTVNFNLIGQKMEDGTVIENTEQITQYILNDAQIGIVPFYSFGTQRDNTWYRVSVGTLSLDDIEEVFNRLEKSLSKLK